MWDSKDVNKLTKGNKFIKNGFKSTIDAVVKSLNDKYKFPYRYGEYKEQWGVLIWQNNRWRWCWINTINTNTGAIAVLLNFINETYAKKLEICDFEEDYIVALKYFNIYIKEHTELFLSGSGNKFFKLMFFETQLSWNKSIFSQLGTMYTLYSKRTDVESIEYTFERGDEKDMKFGVDWKIFLTGDTENDGTTQHKYNQRGFIEFDGEYYWWNYIKYEEWYRPLKYLIIDSEENVYFFKNSQLNNLCGMGTHPTKGYNFKIHKSLLMENGIMEHNEGKEITKMLQEINQKCFEEHIVFFIDEDTTGKNTIERIEGGSTDTIKFILNDPRDKDLYKTILDFYLKFKESL